MEIDSQTDRSIEILLDPVCGQVWDKNTMSRNELISVGRHWITPACQKPGPYDAWSALHPTPLNSLVATPLQGGCDPLIRGCNSSAKGL